MLHVAKLVAFLVNLTVAAHSSVLPAVKCTLPVGGPDVGELTIAE